MPARLTYPGVYVEEQSSGVRTITGVATSTTLFIGQSRKGVLEQPTPIRGLNQFEQIFGTDTGYGELVSQVRQFFLNGGGEAIVARVAGPGVQQASVTLRNANAAPVLQLTAKSAGTLGAELRAAIDYDTVTPELTFNIELFRRSVDTNGKVIISDNEFFGDLTMDPKSPRYAVDFLKKNSELVDAKLPGGVLAATGNGFSQSAIILSTTDATAVATLNTALTTGTALVVAVDGGAAVTVNLPAPVGVLATWLTDVGAAIGAALIANGQPGGVTATLETFGAARALCLTSNGSNGGTSDSVLITAASASDGSRALELGSANGGIEIGRYSRYRPQPTGYVTALHAVGGTFPTSSNLNRLVAFAEATRANLASWRFDDGTGTAAYTSLVAPPFSGPGTTFLLGSASSAGVGSLRNVATHLDTLVASLASRIEKNWSARRVGYSIVLTPNFGTSNTGTAAALSSPAPSTFDIGAAANIAASARSANAQAYALGGSGTGNFQAPGAPGNNGGVPLLASYEPIFDRVAREVDIFNLLCLPRADGQTDIIRATLWGAASAFCDRERAFLIVDPPDDWTNVDKVAAGIPDLRIGVVKDHAAVYWPKVKVASVTLPIDPCGTVAGVMARTDTRRGVWKAPAGLEATLLGTRGLDQLISDPDNGVTNPVAVNTLRTFAGGSVVWGARTMAGFDNSGEDDYRYVPVRRLALFLEESLYRGLQFAVFEPNDEPLWSSIRLAAGAFMQNLYRQGAFQGSKASEAYDVRCDSTTTTQNDINLGRVNVTVAFAPLRPAEFVVLTVRQLAGQVQV
jgi:phage tail sheath protein FI